MPAVPGFQIAAYFPLSIVGPTWDRRHLAGYWINLEESVTREAGPLEYRLLFLRASRLHPTIKGKVQLEPEQKIELDLR